MRLKLEAKKAWPWPPEPPGTCPHPLGNARATCFPDVDSLEPFSADDHSAGLAEFLRPGKKRQEKGGVEV